MKLIKTINLQRLKDRQFVEFALEISENFKKNAKTFEMEALQKSFEKEYQNLQNTFKKLKTNLYTEKIKQMDQRRIHSFRVLWHSSKALSYDLDRQKLTAALKVLDILSGYGGSKISNFDYNGKTAALDNCLQQLNKNCEADLDLLLFKELVVQLEKENEDFRKAYMDRNELIAENQLLGEFRQIRGQMEKIYAALVKQMEILYLSFPEQGVKIKNWIVHLNVIIMKFRPLTLSRTKTVEQEIEKQEEEEKKELE